MRKYMVYGMLNTWDPTVEEEIEADSLEKAEEIAKLIVMDQLDYWAEEITEEEDEDE